MFPSLLPRYARVIRDLDIDALQTAADLPAELRIAHKDRLALYYTPFDLVNPAAKVAIVGITPGFTQLRNALRAAQRELRAGAPDEVVLWRARQEGAFSGPIRPNLVALLDHLGLHRWLGVPSCSHLFGDAGHLMHITGALRHAAFVGGRNYCGSPDMTRDPLLREHLLGHFAREIQALPGAVLVPLGSSVAAALRWLAARGDLDEARILDGLPHPSGANMERIQYFLGKKTADQLSSRTDAARLDAARASVERKARALLEAPAGEALPPGEAKTPLAGAMRPSGAAKARPDRAKGLSAGAKEARDEGEEAPPKGEAGAAGGEAPPPGGEGAPRRR